ncbi:high-affinity nicotinic acid transporter, variant 2 [Coprinopsis cinerea AmutBmut pab1-1]|nr:high-affinity nicotinic acid transporter, variant 2 [Coprinopsis cinerea AmutBmut pab1-1]
MSSHPLDLADEKTDPVPPPEIVEAVEVSRDPKFERRTMLWVDLRILPILAIIQCFSTTEPHNLGSAYAAGLDKALELTVGVRYSIITCIFFVPHILLQLPSNMVLRWIGVRELMTSLILAWGAAQLGMGFVKNWQQLLITRLLLGIFGAPFNGVILFLVSSWYLRHEFQKRLAALAIVITLGTSFSPLLAYGLSLLDGKGGLEGWRWIFIVEGILTVVLGVLTFFFIPGFPDENKFLNAEQTAFVIKRINEDRGDALPDAITVRQVAVHLRDWTLWAYGIIALCSSMSGTVVVYFLPIILTGMGYDLKGTLLRPLWQSLGFLWPASWRI